MSSNNVPDIDIFNDFTEEEKAVFEVGSQPAKKETAEVSDQAVIADYISGMYNKEIMAKYEISSGKLYSILNRNHVKRRVGTYSTSNTKKVKGLSTAEKQRVIALYKDNVEIKDIMDLFELNRTALYTILDQAGVSRRYKPEEEVREIGNIKPTSPWEDTPTVSTSEFKPTKESGIYFSTGNDVVAEEPKATINFDDYTNTLYVTARKGIKVVVETEVE